MVNIASDLTNLSVAIAFPYQKLKSLELSGPQGWGVTDHLV